MRKLILSCFCLTTIATTFGTALFANTSDFKGFELKAGDSSSNMVNEASQPMENREAPQKITALYMVSLPMDYIGGGEVKSYYQDINANFSIRNNRKAQIVRSKNSCEEIEIQLFGTNPNLYGRSDWWSITFRSEEGAILTPGVYTGAEGAHFAPGNCPGLDMSGCGRGCSRLSGEFEVLEILYNEKGKIESFAANFVQRCDSQRPPLFGSIRINSSVPVETCFRALVDDRLDTAFFLAKYNPKIKQATQSILIANENLLYEIKSDPKDPSRNIITVLGNDGEWSFQFRSVSSAKPDRYYGYHRKGILVIRTPQGHFLETKDFKAVSLKRTDGTEYVSLGFEALDSNGEILQGFIRYKPAFE